MQTQKSGRKIMRFVLEWAKLYIAEKSINKINQLVIRSKDAMGGKTIKSPSLFEHNGEETSFYARELKYRGYNYATCILPWDAGLDRMNGRAITTQLRDYGFEAVSLGKQSEQFGIGEGRNLLRTAQFNRTKCSVGLVHLKSFRYRIDPRIGVKLQQTVHDIHSHAADAFRYVAVSKHLWERQIYGNNGGYVNIDYDIYESE
jgi:hypothetical protein